MTYLDMNTLTAYDREEEFSSEEAAEAYREAHYHFILKDFEALLYQFGLRKLLKDMSDNSVDALLAAADDILTEMEK